MTRFVDYAVMITASGLTTAPLVKVDGFWRDGPKSRRRPFGDPEPRPLLAPEFLEAELQDLPVFEAANRAEELFQEAIRNANAAQRQVLTIYGKWLFEQLLLPGTGPCFDDAYEAARNGGFLRFFIKIGGEQQVRDKLAALTYELAYYQGVTNSFLMDRGPHSPVAIYRVDDLDDPAVVEPVRCIEPRAMGGLADPIDHPMAKSHEFFLLFKEIIADPKAGSSGPLKGRIEMRLSCDLPLEDADAHVVVVIAHGAPTGNEPSLLLLEESTPDSSSVRVTVTELANYLTTRNTALAIIMACQDPSSSRVRAELGQQLFRQCPTLKALLTFRSRLWVDTAHKYLRILARKLALTEGNDFELSEALHAAQSELNRPPNRIKFEFAIPTVHLRREIRLVKPPEKDEFREVSLRPVRFRRPDLERWLEKLPRDEAVALAAGVNGLDDLSHPSCPEEEIEIRGGASRWIACYPVTCAQYAEYLNAPGLKWPASTPEEWVDGAMPADWEDRPVTGLPMLEPLKYAYWRSCGSDDGFFYKLPEDNEWIAAAWHQVLRPNAHAIDGTQFPWGDDWDDPSVPRSEDGHLLPVHEAWMNEHSRLFGMGCGCREAIVNLVGEQLMGFTIGGTASSKRPSESSVLAFRELPRSGSMGPEVGFRLIRLSGEDGIRTTSAIESVIERSLRA